MAQNDTIHADRIRILFERSILSNITAMVGSVVFAYIMRAQLDQQFVTLWIGFMFVVVGIRFLIIFNYKKNDSNLIDTIKYENWFAYVTGMVGLGWAAIIIVGLSLDVLEYRIYSLLLLVAIISISVNIYSTSLKTLYFYILPALFSSIPIVLYRGGNDTAIGIGLIVFSLMALRSSKDVSKTLNDVLHLRSNSQDLVNKLAKLEIEKSTTEQRMQGIMDYAPAAIYVKDLDGRFQFLNQKVADLHGMSHDEMIGKTLHEILPDDVADKIQKNDLEVIKSKVPLKYEESAPYNNQMRHYVSIKFPLFNDDDELVAVGGISTDITERVNMEESLIISQQHLLLYREQSPLAVIDWNRDFEFLDWNPAAEKMFGFTKNEVMGNHITKRILPESALEEVNEIWRKLINLEGGTYSLNENVTKDGRIILCEWHNTPLIDSDMNVIGVTSLVEDITERQKNEESVRHAQKMDAVGKLTGGIAHDFNNMLGVILGFTQLLNERVDKDDAKQVKYCKQILHAGESAKKLTSKLLQFSRKDTSSSQITNINETIEDMQHMLEKTLTARIQLVLDMGKNIFPVWLDKTRLEDAILNMCINSMHAMSDGGDLTIKTKNIHIIDLNNHLHLPPGNYALLTIEDTGEGMSAEIQGKIFDPFFTTKKDGGTGLGMSQVYGFVKQSGGEIEVSSKLNQGTKIEVYIPEYQGEEKIKSEIKSVDNKTVQEKGCGTILVVDDETSLLLLMSEILTEQGYSVYCAENAEQALEVLKDKSIGLLLSDVIMPGIDGYQLAKEVNKRYPNVKIQMISGFTGEADENIVNTSWHEERLHKPLDAGALLDRVRILLK